MHPLGKGGRYFSGLTQCGVFVRQDLASPVSDALPATFEMKKVSWHTSTTIAVSIACRPMASV
jgi:hypothetical protein